MKQKNDQKASNPPVRIPHDDARERRKLLPEIRRDCIRKMNRLVFFLLPVITGLFLFCCFPKINQGWLAWGALVPIIFFFTRAPSMRIAFFGSMIAFWIEAFLLLPWIPTVLVHYGKIDFAWAWFLFGLLAVYLALFPTCACLITRYCMDRKGKTFLLIFPFALLLMEYAVSHFFFGGFPWLLTGYSQGSIPLIMQAADLAGVYGISLLIAFANTSLAWYFLRRAQQDSAWPAIITSILIAGCLWYGAHAERVWGELKTDFRVAMLQGNLSADDSGDVLIRKYQAGYEEMVRQLGGENADLLILPESPTPTTYEYSSTYRKTMHRFAQQFPMGVIFNNVAMVEGKEGEKYFNSAYFLGRDGDTLQRYDKIHLVPFGEYIPYQSLFSFAGTITRDVGAFSSGGEYLTPAIANQPVNAIICFEAVFPDLARRFVQKGSKLIINLTNDAWYGNSAAPHQHLAIARWRAVENRRFLLRAANSGISAIITPTGAVQSATKTFERAICKGGFAFLADSTVYTRFGDFLLIPCAIIVVWAVACSRLSEKRRNSK
jgi:apolipoprotein N-acyltransferase